jgi:hypothetical protein
MELGMDISEHVCLWVSGTNLRGDEVELAGFSFDDSFGLGGMRLSCYSGRLALISTEKRLTGDAVLGTCHALHRGRFWQINADFPLATAPFLLTTLFELRMVFKGSASLALAESGSIPAIEEGTFPLVGDSWIGVGVSQGVADVELTAFAFADETFQRSRAFCPWWAEGFDDPNGVTFEIITNGLNARVDKCY